MPLPNIAPPPWIGSPHKKGGFTGTSVLLGNAITILITLYQGWDLGPLMLIYWAQSVIIGGFHIIRILMLRHFCAEGLTYDNKPIPETTKGKRKTAFFFAIHYGFFHLIYFLFICDPTFTGETVENRAPPPTEGGGGILLGILGFIISHAISFFSNLRADLNRRPNIGKLMFLPYLRVIPMHLTLMVAGTFSLSGGSWLLIFFLLIKSAADYLSQIAEHRIFQKTKATK